MREVNDLAFFCVIVLVCAIMSSTHFNHAAELVKFSGQGNRFFLSSRRKGGGVQGDRQTPARLLT